MSELSDLVHRLVEGGADPNTLSDEFEASVADTELWAFWGNGKWRRNMICSKCGSAYGGVCHDPGTNGALFSGDPGYHHNQPGVKMIPYRAWKAEIEAKKP